MRTLLICTLLLLTACALTGRRPEVEEQTLPLDQARWTRVRQRHPPPGMGDSGLRRSNLGQPLQAHCSSG